MRMLAWILMYVSFLIKYYMCEYVHADVSMNLGGPAKVKPQSKNKELYADEQSGTINCLTV